MSFTESVLSLVYKAIVFQMLNQAVLVYTVRVRLGVTVSR